MTARRAFLLVVLLAAAAVGAWGQSVIVSPASLPVGGGVFVVGQTIPLQHLSTNFPNFSTTWSVSNGNLPPGLSLGGTTGDITGIPTLAGGFTFTASANVVGAGTGSRQYTLLVSNGSSLSLTALAHPGAAAGKFYISSTFQVSGGVPGYVYALQAGTNSDGLTIDSASGFLSGIPQAGGVFGIAVIVSDATGAQALGTFNLNVLGIGTAVLPNGVLGTPYSQTLAVVAGTGPFTWSLLSGALPGGLNLSPQGQITGTPTAGGTFPFQVQVTDTATNLSTSKSFSVNIPLNLTITTTSLPNGTVGTLYPSQTLVATGGSGSLTWTLAAGTTLPPGLNLSGQGQIGGTPTQAGTFPFQVQVTDSATGLSATKSLSLIITPTLTVTTTALPNGTIGLGYSQPLAATGGTAPYTWSASGLPAGLAINSSTGVLSGIPTAAGTQTVSVTVTDAVQGSATVRTTLTIDALTISTPSPLPSGFTNVPYSTALTVAGNPTPLTWTVASGTLPAGLNLSATSGVISGTPTVAGSSTFTISATLGAAAALGSAQKQFTLAIAAAPTLTFTGIPAAAGVQNTITGTISAPVNLPITGQMALTFAPSVGVDDPNIQFVQSGSTTGSRNIAFAIPANTTAVAFTNGTTRISTGTVAGTITIATSLRDSAGNALPSPANIVITINPTVPVIRAVTVGTITTSGFSISVTGFSTPRDMTSAKFHFTSPTNTQLASADVVVPLTTAFTAWYSNPASNAFGSQFTMTVQFSFSGPPGTTVPFTTVTVTLTNSRGDSAASAPVSP